MIPADFMIAGGFYTFAATAVLGAMGVILARSVFHSALFLVATLMSVAAIYVILGADFLGVAQVLVYVGAIMVLILFGIMLTPQNASLPDLGSKPQLIFGGLAAFLSFVVIAAVVIEGRWPRATNPPLDIATTQAIGRGLLTTYAFPFEVASALLLVAMIGAIVIARED